MFEVVFIIYIYNYFIGVTFSSEDSIINVTAKFYDVTLKRNKLKSLYSIVGVIALGLRLLFLE